MRYFVDCEFDGHGGPLLSMALVGEDMASLYVRTLEAARDPWVVASVVPLLDALLPDCGVSHAVVPINEVGGELRRFIGADSVPVIVADSPVDIGRFCQAISTGADGGWASADYALMAFQVINVDCYPTTLKDAVQHNAWWDAMALREKTLSQGSSNVR